MDKKNSEHVYDEIKQNNSAYLEYDHLDYTRAQTDRKPHYQRMANSIGSNYRDSGCGPSRVVSSSSHNHNPESDDK